MNRGDIAYLGGGTEVLVQDLLGRKAAVEVLEDDGEMLQGQWYEVALCDLHREDPKPNRRKA